MLALASKKPSALQTREVGGHPCCSFRGEQGLERLRDARRMSSGPGASRVRTTPAPWGSIHCHPVLHMWVAQLKSCLPQPQGSQQNSLRVRTATLDHKALNSEAVQFFWGLRKARCKHGVWEEEIERLPGEGIMTWIIT